MKALKPQDAPRWIQSELAANCGKETPAFKGAYTRFVKARTEADVLELRMKKLCPHPIEHVEVTYFCSTDTLGVMRTGHYSAKCKRCDKRLGNWET
jgi:hypothetical protein